MKQYAEALVARLKTPVCWPGIKTVEHLEQLQVLASEAKGRATIDGYLAAMLIVHQITEEFIKVLIEDAHFYTQLRLYPLPFQSKKNSKVMFGYLLSELKATVWFQNKKYIVEKAENLNKIRIDIVHGLTKPGALQAVEQNATKAWELYCSLSFLALESHMAFQEEYKNFYLNPDWPPKDTVILRDDGATLG